MIFIRHNLIRIAALVLCCSVFTAGCSRFTTNMGRHAAHDQKGAELLLAKDGVPTATIVVAREANRSARFAAAELQHHFEKITGAKLPIVSDEAAVKGTRILHRGQTSKLNLWLHDGGTVL